MTTVCVERRPFVPVLHCETVTVFREGTTVCADAFRTNGRDPAQTAWLTERRPFTFSVSHIGDGLIVESQSSNLPFSADCSETFSDFVHV
jgi:hypothetical protein